MSTLEVSENKKWYQCHYRIIGFVICVMLFLLMFGNWLAYYYIDKGKKNSTELISSILSNASKEKSLIPDIIIINKTDSAEIKLDSTLKIELIKFLTQKYTKSDTNFINDFDIKPYVLSTDIKDEDKIIKHIQFLVNTVNTAIAESKANVDTEIENLNTWVTIWIGVIGFLGIFFPLIINIKSLDELKSIKSKVKSAKSQAKIVKENLDGYKPQLDGLPDLITQVKTFDDKIKEQEDRIENLKKNYSKVEINATNAINKSSAVEKALSILNMIYKLKDIDGSFLMYSQEPLKTVVKFLEEIHTELSGDNIDVGHPIIFDALRQLALRIYAIAPYSFITRDGMTLLNSFSEFITTKLHKGITVSDYIEILSEFNKVITKLKRD